MSDGFLTICLGSILQAYIFTTHMHISDLAKRKKSENKGINRECPCLLLARSMQRRWEIPKSILYSKIPTSNFHLTFCRSWYLCWSLHQVLVHTLCCRMYFPFDAFISFLKVLFIIPGLEIMINTSFSLFLFNSSK